MERLKNAAYGVYRSLLKLKYRIQIIFLYRQSFCPNKNSGLIFFKCTCFIDATTCGAVSDTISD